MNRELRLPKYEVGGRDNVERKQSGHRVNGRLLIGKVVGVIINMPSIEQRVSGCNEERRATGYMVVR